MNILSLFAIFGLAHAGAGVSCDVRHCHLIHVHIPITGIMKMGVQKYYLYKVMNEQYSKNF